MLLSNRHIFFILLIGFALINKAQNRIKNSSFEFFNTPANWSNYGGGFFDPSVVPVQRIVMNWEVFNSPDYFTSYYPYPNGVASIPSNWFGNSFPKNGTSYAGMYVFNSSTENKEYIYQHLATPLKIDSVYCLSFFVNRADRTPLAIKTFGALFSVNIPTLITSYYISAVPQVVHQNTFITDTIAWTEVQGCFTAQGGEEYITIGNFNSNADTDTLRIQSTNPLTGTGTDVAYYYIDSITLWKNNLPTGIKKLEDRFECNLYPNPNKGVMTLMYDAIDNEGGKMQILDITGKLVNEYSLQGSTGSLNINEESLHNGIYFYRILVNGKVIKTDKVVIIK